MKGSIFAEGVTNMKLQRLICIAGGVLMLSATVAQAQYTNLHQFGAGSDGAQPDGSLTPSGAALYGMTESGGANGGGVIFAVNTNGSNYTVLQSLESSAEPNGSLTVSSDGTLYGMTRNGGGNGRIFAVTVSGGYTYVTRYSFLGGANGSQPYGSLTLSADQTALFGLTELGGAAGYGVIFKVNTDGSNYTKLHDFSGSTTDGANPYGSLTLSQNGATLFGMTKDGGASGNGVIFKIGTNGTGYAKLYEFTGGTADGAYPYGSLTLSGDGTTLFGMTQMGGADGFGVMFKIGTDGSGYSVLHNFAGGTEGAMPRGSLTLSSDGTALFGMTEYGGTPNCGVIFKIKTNGSAYTNQYVFSGSTTGAHPSCGSPILSGDGTTLLGMTQYGGTNGYGVIFALPLAAASNSNQVVVTGAANPTSGGTVLGGGTYPTGTNVQLVAAPVSGWTFTGWNDGGSGNPRTITVPASNITFTANFSSGTYSQVVVTGAANPASGGTVLGGGTYPTGTNVQLVAAPASGWTFTGWNDGGNGNPRTITVPATNITFTANFSFGSSGQATVTGVANPTGGGSVTGGGTFQSGTSVQLTANPSSGWAFTGWNDGSNANPRTITVPATDISCTANFLFVQSQFSYTTNQGTISIQSYIGSGGAVFIPSRINGLQVTSIGAFAFADCTNVTSVALIPGITTIGDFAFAGCTDLTSVTIPDSVMTIGRYAFDECNNLISFILGSSVSNLEDGAFAACSGLTGFYCRGNAPTPGLLIFNFDTTAIVYYLQGTTGWSTNFAGRPTALWQQTNSVSQAVVSVTANPTSGGTVSGGGTYQVSTSVQLTAAPFSGWTFTGWRDGVTDNPRTITVPATNITYTANFSSSTSNQAVVSVTANPTSGGAVSGGGTYKVGASVQLTATPVSGWAFTGWNDGNTANPRLISVPATNSTYTAGFIYVQSQFTFVVTGQNTITIIGYTGSGGAMFIPSMINGLPVTSIYDQAFKGNTSLTSVMIPNSVTSIGHQAFMNCTSLANATLGDGITIIGEDAFYETRLTSIIIPDSVITIEQSAFFQCSNLAKVILGSGASSLGDWSFDLCTNLTGFYCRGNAPSFGQYVFNFDTNATVYYLPGTTGWSTSFAGRPTAVWQTQSMDFTNGAHFYLQDTTGNVTLWAVNTQGFLQQYATLGGMGAWNLKAIGDVNCDGKADLFWQMASGWAVAHLSQTNNSYVGVGLGNLGAWALCAVGDVDGDGVPDLIWQHQSGWVVIWYMNTNGTSPGSASLGNLGVWKLKGAGDINGDGKADLIWQSPMGDVVVWMSQSGGGYQGLGVGNLGTWELRAVADVDGDGIADLLWENPSGWVVVWYLNADGTLRAGAGLGNVGTAKIMAVE